MNIIVPDSVAQLQVCAFMEGTQSASISQAQGSSMSWYGPRTVGGLLWAGSGAGIWVYVTPPPATDRGWKMAFLKGKLFGRQAPGHKTDPGVYLLWAGTP
eukprot:EG_transcript_27924